MSELRKFQNAQCYDKKKKVASFNFCLPARPIVANSIRRFVCDIFFKVFTITVEIPALQNVRSTIIILFVDDTLFCLTSCMQLGVKFPYQRVLK